MNAFQIIENIQCSIQLWVFSTALVSIQNIFEQISIKNAIFLFKSKFYWVSLLMHFTMTFLSDFRYFCQSYFSSFFSFLTYLEFNIPNPWIPQKSYNFIITFSDLRSTNCIVTHKGYNLFENRVKKVNEKCSTKMTLHSLILYVYIHILYVEWIISIASR